MSYILNRFDNHVGMGHNLISKITTWVGTSCTDEFSPYSLITKTCATPVSNSQLSEYIANDCSMSTTCHLPPLQLTLQLLLSAPIQI